MPQVEVVFFRESDGTVPVIEWLDDLPVKARGDKCIVTLERLGEFGHELRRPIADYLRDDMYELRVGLQGVNYRLLYFFHGRKAAVVSHDIVKERVVPCKEIEKAIERKRDFERNPRFHTFKPEDTP